MSLNPLLIALAGLGSSPLQVALNGLLPDAQVVEAPRYYSVGGMTPQMRRRAQEEDELLLAILQVFVTEA